MTCRHRLSTLATPDHIFPRIDFTRKGGKIESYPAQPKNILRIFLIYIIKLNIHSENQNKNIFTRALIIILIKKKSQNLWFHWLFISRSLQIHRHRVVDQLPVFSDRVVVRIWGFFLFLSSADFLFKVIRNRKMGNHRPTTRSKNKRSRIEDSGENTYEIYR